MKHHTIKRIAATAISAALLLSTFATGFSASAETAKGTLDVLNLKVASNVEPLAVEDENPTFSWQMTSDQIGAAQSAYQIVVTDAKSNIVWDSGKVASNASSDIFYDGQALIPESDYNWSLKVWDQNGNLADEEKSRFATGLMDPDQSAWDGAEFIGSTSPVLDATASSVWNINSDVQLTEGTSFSLIFGADDFRMNDNFQNVQNVEGENYIRFEFDLANRKINVYRVGYAKGDSADTIYESKELADDVFLAEEMYDVHNIDISCETGSITVKVDGKSALKSTGGGGWGGPWGGGGSSISISTMSTGNNFNTFPNLCSVGFASTEGNAATYTNYKIVNVGRSNKATLFDSTTGATYSIWDGTDGIAIDGDAITVSGDVLHYADPSFGSVPMVRTEFATESGKTIKSAKMYATAMGIYEMYINGERMGEDWFNPADTQYRETLGYHAYDVTDMLNAGENAIGAQLGNGWYIGYMTFSPGNFNFFGDYPALLAKLVITYEDGSTQTIVTDPDTWQVYENGPIEYGDFFQGERYNANKEAAVKDYSTAAYDASGWDTPEIIEKRDWIDFDIVARYDAPIREFEVLTAQRVLNTHSDDGQTYTYDMGVAMAGVPSITIPAGTLQEGDTVILRYGEDIYPGNEDSQNTNDYYTGLYGENGTYRAGVAGRVLHDTYRAALATDFYTASKEDETRDVVIQPSTTYRGYRYIQITIPGSTEPLPLENIDGIVLSSVQEITGTYNATTTDETITRYVNQLFKNIQRSQLGNFMSIPTDCPQRNERMGWTGDAQAFSRTSTYNADTYNFFRQWMVALRNDQSTTGGIGSTVPTYNTSRDTSFADGTTWAAAVCMVPWQLYTQYGDTQIISENFETMKAWLDGMDSFDFTAQGKTYTGLSGKTSGLADWLSVDGTTTSDIVNNAIYIYMMEVTAEMSDAIGETEYAETLRARHDLAKAEWNEVYVDPKTGMTRNANAQIIDSQSSYATPMNFNCFSDENLPFAAQRLAEIAADPNQSGNGKGVTQSSFGPGGGSSTVLDCPAYSITTGFSGTPNILPALTRTGNVETAYQMITCTDYASWLYPVTLGATTAWERWNSYELAFKDGGESSMNSFNHFALGSVGSWMYEYQLGITTDHQNGGAGYQDFVLQPQAGSNYEALEGSYTSNYGVIDSAWTAAEGAITNYRATVPASTTATLYLPVEAADAIVNTSGAEYIGNDIRNNVICAVFKLTAGGYDFAIENGIVTVNAQEGYTDENAPVKSVSAPESAQVNADFAVTVVTAKDVTDVRLFNANGMSIGRKDIDVTENADGTKTFVITVALGTVGDAREIKVMTKDAAGILTDSGMSVMINITSIPPVLSSFDMPESAAANRTFIVKATTDMAATKIAVYNEFGTKMGVKSLSYKVVDGQKVWTGVMSIGTKGERTFTAYAVNKYGAQSDTMTDSISVKAFA